MKNLKIFVVLSGIVALFFGLTTKRLGVTGFQEKLGKSINIENALFADDSKTPPAKSALG